MRYKGDGGIELELPYEVLAVRELRIDRSFNEHTRCFLTLVMNEAEVARCIEEGSFRDRLLIQKVSNTGTEYWFAGGIAHIDVTYEDGIAHVKLEGISRSYCMDERPQNRSYQNKNTTYTKLIQQLMADYPGGAAQNEATHPETTIGELLVQYQETNWAFMKRLASKVGTVILPDVAMDVPRIYFGVPDFSWGKEMTATHYKVTHDQQTYLNLVMKGEEGANRSTDLTNYEVHSQQYYQVGENVSFKGELWVVFASVITYEKGLLDYEYKLVQRKGIKSITKTNHHIQGIALEGRVVKRANNMVQVHLDIDENYDEDSNWWFPYSSEGNNMFHALPEEGARIKVYFPGGKEKKAIAINSVRGKHEEMKGRTVFQKPTTKVFHIPGDAKMELGEDGVLFHKNTVQLQLDANDIRLKSEEGIMVIAKQSISLGSKNNTPDYIKLFANTSITLLTAEKRFIYIEKDYVAIQSKKIHFDKVHMDFTDMLNEDEILEIYLESIADEEVIKETQEYYKNLEVSAGTYVTPKVLTPDQKAEERIQVKDKVRTRLKSEEGSGIKTKAAVKALGEEQAKAIHVMLNESNIKPPKRRSKAEKASERERNDRTYAQYVYQQKVQSGIIKTNTQALSTSFPLHNLVEKPAVEFSTFDEKMAAYTNFQQEALNRSMPGFTDWYNLEYVIPGKPEYVSKETDQGICYSRYTFEQQIINPQKSEAWMNLIFGIIAIATAIPSGGGSMYLFAIANGVWGVTQVGVSMMKLSDLNNGDGFTNPKLLNVDQNALDTAGTILGIVDLAMLGKAGARFARNKMVDARRSMSMVGVNSPAVQRMLKEMGVKLDNTGAKVRAGLKDLNVKLNPTNYGPEPHFQLEGTSGSWGGKWTRLKDEPLFRFSGSGGGPESTGDLKFTVPDDPMRDVTGPARISNPAEYNDILNQLKEMGVEVNISDGTTGARAGYGPSTMGQPGQISVDPNVSLSALKHELQHAIDDMNSGWIGRQVKFSDPDLSIQWERNAYEIEIEAAKSAGRQDVADYLEKLFQQEAERTRAFFRPDN